MFKKRSNLNYDLLNYFILKLHNMKMTSEIFIELIRKNVLESSITSMESILNKPPGKRLVDEIITMSAWYNKLSENDKTIIQNIIRESARSAVFGFLCVLDGVRDLESQDKGELKLFYDNYGERLLINDPHKGALHELL